MKSEKKFKSPTLAGMLASYSRAVSDPKNELVYLYEVGDALEKHYGCNARRARAALKIAEGEWSRLEELANSPLEQGRHRGSQIAGRRDATGAELEEARSIVRRWIIAFAQTV